MCVVLDIPSFEDGFGWAVHVMQTSARDPLITGPVIMLTDILGTTINSNQNLLSYCKILNVHVCHIQVCKHLNFGNLRAEGLISSIFDKSNRD